MDYRSKYYYSKQWHLKGVWEEGGIWYHNLNNSFQFLNNIYTYCLYFQKIQTMLLEQYYQMGPQFLGRWDDNI